MKWFGRKKRRVARLAYETAVARWLEQCAKDNCSCRKAIEDATTVDEIWTAYWEYRRAALSPPLDKFAA